MTNKTCIIIRFLFLCLFVNSGTVIRSQSLTISGYVSDGNTHETLIGATIQVKTENRAAVTDGNGFFSITGIKKGDYILVISHIGYRPEEINLKVENKGIVLKDIYLTPAPLSLEEVSIVALKPDKITDRTV